MPIAKETFYVGKEGLWELSELSAQLFCKPETYVKNKIFFLNMCVLLRILVGKLAQSTTYKNEQLSKEYVSSF